MNYRNILLTSLLLCGSAPLFTVAIDTTRSGRILDNFKKEEYAILFENAPVDESGSNDLLEKEYTMNGLDALRKKLKEMEEAYRDKKAVISERKQTLQEAVTSLENAISDTYDTIERTEKSLHEKDQRIDEYQSLSIELSGRIDKNRATILSYLANIYSEGNVLFDGNNSLDVIQGMILSSDSVDVLSQDILYKSLVNVLGQKFVDEYKSLVRDYYRTAMKIREEQALLSEEKLLLEKQKETLAAQRNQRQALLDATKGQEALFDSYIEEQRKAQEQVENSWKTQSNEYNDSLESILEQNGCKEEKKSSATEQKCKRIVAYYKNEGDLIRMNSASGSVNPLSWPISGDIEISTYFRDPEYYRSFGSQHDAIDIVATQGTDIYAPADGYVYYVLPPAPGGYSYLALKHSNGYVTVYGHLSDVKVDLHKFVRKGELIAKTGGAPGTPGAGPMTSGAHLHFEVYLNQRAIDPLRVLDISKIPYSDLPVRYQDKFLSDITGRLGGQVSTDDFERKFVLKGTTEEDRQKYLLKTYASPDFQSWNTWVDSALDAHIDPSFLMCVGLAETTLGNYLKTSYNVGNVGNTDSGDVVSFSSPREGIDWMVATFNNKYLSRYNMVSELSRWGNTDGPIYASSNANWHNNIIKCLSALKGRFVEDDYHFRAGD